MKILIAVIAAGAMLAGCQSSSGASGPKTTTKSFKYSTDDGSTMVSAVQIRTRSATEGSTLIWDWIRANYPGFVIDGQELMRDDQRDRMLNLITIVNPSNTVKRVYFDVTQFHRRYSEELPNQFPPVRQ